MKLKVEEGGSKSPYKLVSLGLLERFQKSSWHCLTRCMVEIKLYGLIVTVSGRV